jgi:hypothetical protein
MEVISKTQLKIFREMFFSNGELMNGNKANLRKRYDCEEICLKTQLEQNKL